MTPVLQRWRLRSPALPSSHCPFVLWLYCQHQGTTAAPAPLPAVPLSVIKERRVSFSAWPSSYREEKGKEMQERTSFLKSCDSWNLGNWTYFPKSNCPWQQFLSDPSLSLFRSQVFIFIFFFSPVHLRRGVIDQLYWATGVQPDSTHESRWGTKLWNPAGSLMSYWLPGWPEHQWWRKRTKNQEPQRNQDKPGVKSKKRITWNSEIICPPQKELFPMDTS